ncbi:MULTISPECIES: hypothetical protein [Alcaligenaceae]|uniref:hypothetical protein n=1 Tax=Alcaligenaceae TaxID=506 RepID=UPI000F4C046F|nr:MULTISPECIES: hypothetical protein [Alcaligenaceae]
MTTNSEPKRDLPTMHTRVLISFFAASAALLLAGCEQATQAPQVTGYWLQQTDKRPMSLHIKPDGEHYIVNVGRMNFGSYDVTAQPAALKADNTLTINQRKQLRLDPASDTLSDVDHPSIRFSRITQAHYEQATQVPPRR